MALETLEFSLPSADAPNREAMSHPTLVGVVGSGNCELLLTTGGPSGQFSAAVETSALGFAPIWRAVLDDFAGSHAAGGLRAEIHDVGATPAVVALRLGQAYERLSQRPQQEAAHD